MRYRHFATILNFLRQGSTPLPECRTEVEEILQEARFYCIQELIQYCTEHLLLLNRAPCWQVDFPRIPLLISREDVEKVLLSCSDRPMIELLINRQNNKYSYTHNSDENFLRNQELFDKLVLRFNHRVLFVKNVGVGSSEVCQWAFYSNGHKRVEICCSSIVYATDKKQTKVEFPEARIYEEAMNALLTYDQETAKVCSRCRTLQAPSAARAAGAHEAVAGNFVVEPIFSSLRHNLADEQQQVNAAKAHFGKGDLRMVISYHGGNGMASIHSLAPPHHQLPAIMFTRPRHPGELPPAGRGPFIPSPLDAGGGSRG